MNTHRFAPTILRAYDIRGIYQDTLTEADARAIGMAFVACLRVAGMTSQLLLAVTSGCHRLLRRGADRRVSNSWRQSLGYRLWCDANADAGITKM